MALSFTEQTVVVTGAGRGIGKTFSLLLALRGANVVVNDLDAAAAQKVVDEITKAGGMAVANTSSATDGTAIIQSALDAFGSVTILINNAEIPRNQGFESVLDDEGDETMGVHLKGAFSCTKAAWPHFRKQMFGRIINVADAAGLYGNSGQACYSAVKMGLIGFTKSLAHEGTKYNIKATAIAPVIVPDMAQAIISTEMLTHFSPDHVAPFVVAICHPDGPDASGKVFELGAGFIAQIRWERSEGCIFKVDSSFTPSAVKERWSEVVDFSKPDFPITVADVDSMGKLERARQIFANKQSSPEVRFDGQTVIITGAGAGLGRAYSHMYGRLGANVVVNDIDEKGANAVVEEVTKAGGKAVAAVCSTEDGEAIVKTALEKFGGIHVLIANAGILRSRSLASMTDHEWDLVLTVHLRGTYKCAKAVWPHFQKQKFGRIVATCSPVGIYGHFAQTNYSTAKAGILGLTRTLAIEGRKYNILANAIAPSAGTAMTSFIWSQVWVDAFKPDYVAPLVGYLSSSDNAATSGSLFEVHGGWAAQTRWQRAGGHSFPSDKLHTPEDVVKQWGVITNFDDGRATHPTSIAESFSQILGNLESKADDAKARL